MMIKRFHFNKNSQIIEIASNDGYLLQYFKNYGIPVLGVEPTVNTAREAEKRGIPTIVDFFSEEFAQNKLIEKGIKADLLLGNNVLAHVPDINDFVKGLKKALKDNGIVTFEFPHLLKLIEFCQFDTIYHEHFSYLSFYTVNNIFMKFGLEIFDVEELSTHGGSLRVFAKHKDDQTKVISTSVNKLLETELRYGITDIKFYSGFQKRIDKIKYDTISFLIEQTRNNKKIIGYGAAAKGNTLLNYCGIKNTDIVKFVVDASPHKQNKVLPGSHIPVVDKLEIIKYKPDYIVILPWNLKEEISNELSYVREWGCKFVIFIPEISIF
jgi:SAM-dependent methyltransferase